MKFHLERSTLIQADLTKVKKIVEDFKTWNSWSPWTMADPECNVKISGEAGRAGHSMDWDGEIIGAGTHVISETKPKSVHFNLEFTKPNRSKAQTAFRLSESNKGTKVIWEMEGNMPFFLFFLIPMMKAWIGMDYDRGLRMLKEVAEKGKVEAKTSNAGMTNFEGFKYVGIQKTCPIKEVGPNMKPDFKRLMEFTQKNNKCGKHWISLYPKMNIRKGEITYISAVSCQQLDGVELDSDFVTGEIKSGKMLEIKHHGSYDFLGNAWSMGSMYMRAKKVKGCGVPFEYYHNDPNSTEPKDLKTSIYFPVKG